jgi:sulfate transport system permease protein
MMTPHATQMSPPARIALIALTVGLLVILLLLPLIVVFTEALSHGLAAVLDALNEPDAISAIELTLLVVVFSVPLNTVCGVAAAWCIGRFRFRGRSLLIT